MAASELQDRLDYLVSYASQLIFINGETADQSSVFDTFITHSPEQVEIALLTASPTTVLAQYRERLYRQLISQTKSTDFNRPLNQLLVALNQHNGPLIISISKAENLPDKLLQELWELVLQSRFANNKQHLNVLLFAQGAWAKQARNKLQSRTGDKPLLLNNSTSLPQMTQSTSNLDKLITLKRQQFSERLQKRAQVQSSPLPLLKRKAVIAIFVSIFLLLFAGIVGLQYPSLFSSNNAVATILGSTEQSNDLSSVQDEIGITPAPITDEQLIETQPVTDVDTTQHSANKILENKRVFTDDKASSPDPLVTSWSSALAKIEENSSQYLLATPQEAVIEDQTTARSEYKKTDTSNAIQANIVENNNIVLPIKTPTNIPLTENLGALPSELALLDGQYLIQISAMSDNYLLQQFMQENPLRQQVWTYTTQRFGGDWFVLLFNHVYPSLEHARAALNKLPSSIIAYEPFVKSARQVKQELRQKGV
ncbi:hypothetical protein [Paraglaciecola sp.]|uniref:SPOR domain-containing protein n=1 Tax=Paraglaciecola sp. TaxID=1920173 RepID=UPI0030F42602